jgi:diguanylate cyclase (GGDEF)-like protein/PAS domain S-box-containing protein
MMRSGDGNRIVLKMRVPKQLEGSRGVSRLTDWEMSWRRVFEHGACCRVLTAADGRILALNRAARVLLGPAARGRGLLQLYPAWAAAQVAEQGFPMARRNGHWRGEVAVLAGNGEQRAVSQVMEYHRAGIEPEHYSVALYELQDYDAFDSRLRFKGLFEAHPHPMWVYDLDTLRFLIVNAAAVRHYGYSEHEFLSMTIRDIRPPSDVTRLDQNVAATPAKGPDRAGLWTHVKRDGTRITVDISSHSLTMAGRPARFVFAHDVTEQLRIEGALHAAQQMQRQVIDHVPQQIFWKDLDSVYQGCNAVFARAAGLPSSTDVAGKRDTDMPWAHLAGQIVANDRSVIDTALPLLNTEQSFVLPDGTTHWVLVNLLPLHDRQGVIVGVLGTLEEVTERKRAALTQQLQSRAIEASVNAIVITASHPDGELIDYANPAFATLSGYSAAETLGRHPEFLLAQGNAGQGGKRAAAGPDPADLLALRAAFEAAGEGNILLRNYRKDGTPFWNQWHVAPVRGPGGTLSHHVCVMNDMTAVIDYQAQLEHQANHDALTQLPNRKLFADRLHQAVAYAQRYRHALWVVFIDLDNFKLINDSLGHHLGDELLRRTGSRLLGCVRDSDTVARLGGDEFMLILHDEPQGHLSPALLQKLVDSVSAPVQLNDQQLIVTCSVGVSLYPQDGADAQQLQQQADIAMYRAKEEGRNQIQFYEPAMNQRVAERTLIEGHLRHALGRGELSLHYQPRVDLRSGQVYGMEALLRWRHPELGQVPPVRFIGVAEETGLIVEIGAWVLRTACQQNADWQAAGLPQLRVAVNLSARQFHDKGLEAHIVAALEDSGLEPQYLELELTESLMMENVDAAVDTLTRLKQLGVALSIDDFGTGYSSLAYLKLFPLDYLKIDRSFIQDMLGDPSGAAIVRSVIALGHSLNFKIIAEGVETAAQLAYLSRYQCDEMQGFLYSRPIPAAEFAKLLGQPRTLPGTQESQERRPTLLLVDEDAATFAELSGLLENDGYAILHAATPALAFDALATHDVQVLVSGKHSAGDGGADFLKRVTTMYPGTVRIVLSEFSNLEVVLDAMNGGEAYRFRPRPWQDQALREHIRDAFSQYRMMRGQPQPPALMGAGTGQI